MRNTDLAAFSAVIIVYLVLFLATSHYPFFWDTVQLASKHANWFYQNGFRDLLLPVDFDSGHFPVLGLYLAVCWKIFGRTLFISHLIMLPFILGIIWQTWLLVKKIFSEKWKVLAFVVILSDPTLMAQCTLISPDIFLVFFFLLALNSGIFGKKKILFMVALLGLSVSSLRGMICIAAIFIADMAIKQNLFNTNSMKTIIGKIIKNLPEIITPYIPSFIFIISFLTWHMVKTGWIGYHDESPWYDSFKPVDISGVIRNVFIIGWRLADFGHIFVWITGIFCFWNFLRHKIEKTESLNKLITIFLVILICLAVPMLFHKNLTGHRYLLPVYILLALTVCYCLFEITEKHMIKTVFATLMIAGLLSGNFWVYPDKISQGWDASLAYLPYPPLRKEMINYMKENSIPFSETGSGFPNLAALDYIDLNGSKESFATKNLKTNKYIFWSNIFNDFSDDEIDRLRKEWIIIKENKCMNVKVVLYKNPELSHN
ncbi:MAG TPA: hypothetical protein PK496_01425 [Bacteroidales bacterium]|nr:hypothetical protein [Bacteroidales bacterium]